MTRVIALLLGLVFSGCAKESAAPESKSPPAEPEGQSSQSGRLSEPTWKLSAEPVVLRPGVPGVAALVVTPGAGWKVSIDFPTRVSGLTGSGVDPSGEAVAADAIRLSEKALRAEVSLTAAEPGAASLDGTLHFALCSAETCVPLKTPVSWPVTVR